MVPTRKSLASESRSCRRPCGSIVVKRFWVKPRGTLCDELRIPFENCNRATTECDLGDSSATRVGLVCLECTATFHVNTHISDRREVFAFQTNTREGAGCDPTWATTRRSWPRRSALPFLGTE
jgi:hypothetical protein